jgi:hypothetical protein
MEMCTCILNKQKCNFSFLLQIREQEGGTDPAWGAGGTVGEGGEDREGAWEGEHGANTVYTCM